MGGTRTTGHPLFQEKKGSTMSPPADKTQVFIVRLWLEEREIQGAEPVWRGVVEHVASGQRRYLEYLDEIPAFIAGYLRSEG
jgi:hypothetical protein